MPENIIYIKKSLHNGDSGFVMTWPFKIYFSIYFKRVVLKIKTKTNKPDKRQEKKATSLCEWSAYFDEPQDGSVFVALHHEFTELHIDVLFTRAHQTHSSPLLKVLEELKIARPHCHPQVPTDRTNTIQSGRKPEITRNQIVIWSLWHKLYRTQYTTPYTQN